MVSWSDEFEHKETRITCSCGEAKLTQIMGTNFVYCQACEREGFLT